MNLERYRERPPRPVLADWLVCAWNRTNGDAASEQVTRVVPDGCLDIIWFDDGQLVVAGPDTRAMLSSLQPRAEVAGVRFRPGMAPSFLGMPASELRDLRVPLLEVWGDDALRLLERHERLRSPEARLVALEDALMARLPSVCAADRRVQAAVARLARQPGLSVAGLSRSLEMSERHLLRRFDAAVGYGPKTFGRILRFQRVQALARRAPADRGGLAWLAAEAGYADQAHMTREVTLLAGVPPGTLLAGAGPVVSDSFKTTDAWHR